MWTRMLVTAVGLTCTMLQPSGSARAEFLLVDLSTSADLDSLRPGTQVSFDVNIDLAAGYVLDYLAVVLKYSEELLQNPTVTIGELGHEADFLEPIVDLNVTYDAAWDPFEGDPIAGPVNAENGPLFSFDLDVISTGSGRVYIDSIDAWIVDNESNIHFVTALSDPEFNSVGNYSSSHDLALTSVPGPSSVVLLLMGVGSCVGCARALRRGQASSNQC